MDHPPVLPPSRLLFRDVRHRQNQHFQQAVVRGKHRFGPGHLAQLTVEILYGVGGVDQPVHFLRVLEIYTQIDPVCPPGLGDSRIFPVLALSKGVQGIHACSSTAA